MKNGILKSTADVNGKMGVCGVGIFTTKPGR
jgi:hypothetical protein